MEKYKYLVSTKNCKINLDTYIATSYNNHFVIGKSFGDTYLVSDSHYSKTTSRHERLVEDWITINKTVNVFRIETNGKSLDKLNLILTDLENSLEIAKQNRKSSFRQLKINDITFQIDTVKKCLETVDWESDLFT